MSLSFAWTNVETDEAPSAAAPTPAATPAAAAGATRPVAVARFPTTLAEVKAQMQAAKAAREAAATAAAGSNGTPKSCRPTPSRPQAPASAPAASSRPSAAAPPSASASPSLLSLRIARESLLDARRSLEHRLGSIVWVEFGRQALALDFLAQRHRPDGGETGGDGDSDGRQLRLFAVELPPRRRADGAKVHTGARRFIVSTYEDFWVRYFTFSPSQRHHYEVILEGAPCHLYLDIEFKRKCNPQLQCDADQASAAAADSSSADAVDVEAVMAALCDELVDVLNERFGGAAVLGARVEQILQLDSTSAVKFSRHLIVRLAGPTASADAAEPLHPRKKPSGASGAPHSEHPPPPPRFMFRDNAHAGRFVRFFCQHISKIVLQAQSQQQQKQQQDVVEEEKQTHASPDCDAALSDAAAAAMQKRQERVRLLQYILVRESDEDVAPAAAQRSTAESDSADSAAAAAGSAAPCPSAESAGAAVGSLTSLIDPAVYTRNRSFRCFLSAKIGRVPVTMAASSGGGHDDHRDGDVARPHGLVGSGSTTALLEAAPTLLVADVNRYPTAGRQLRDIFLDSLVCNVQCPWSELRLLSFSELDAGSVEAAAGLALLPGGALESSGAEVNANGKRSRGPTAASAPAAAAGPAPSSASTGSRRFHPCPSPFPRLEQFLLSRLRERSVEARVRGWTYFKEQRHGATVAAGVASTSPPSVSRHTVSFSVDGYRFCGNIGRAHRSNGVYFLLDLAARSLVQRCWDSQCRYYSSPPEPVPNWIADLDLRDVEGGEEGEQDADDDFAWNEQQEEELVRIARQKAQRTADAPLPVVAGSRSVVDSASAPALPEAAVASSRPAGPFIPDCADDDDDWDVDVLAALEAEALKRRATPAASTTSGRSA